MLAEKTKQSREELNRAYLESPLRRRVHRIIDSNMPAVLERAKQRAQRESNHEDTQQPLSSLPPDMRPDSGMNVGG